MSSWKCILFVTRRSFILGSLRVFCVTEQQENRRPDYLPGYKLKVNAAIRGFSPLD